MAIAASKSARPSGPLTGEIAAPGDKSVSHRIILFGALAEGETRARGLLDGEDVLRTAAAVRAFGADVERRGDEWRIHGAPWAAPARAIYCGNSGTTMRLMTGAAAGRGASAVFDGDPSLRARPMERIAEPLRMMGARVATAAGRPPVSLHAAPLVGIDYRSPRASAQVKSAVLLAGLGAEGRTRIVEPALSRDHTERLLAAFGVDVERDQDADGLPSVCVEGGARLAGVAVDAPGDPSSAAFPLVAALIVPGSDVVVGNVGLNPTRTGLFETLKEMGAALEIETPDGTAAEPAGRVRARASALRGVRVPAARAPSMIDEFPVLAVAAACATGESLFEGVGELRVKESDRLAVVAAGLSACGVPVETGPDWMRIEGLGRPPAGGARVAVERDHRIAMSFLVLGLAAAKGVAVDDAGPVATSYPTFFRDLAALGAEFA